MVSPYRRHKRDKEEITEDREFSLAGRVSAVETAIDHIESGMREIRASIGSGFRELKHDLDSQSEYNKPKLVAWAGWAGVLLLIIGMFGSGYVRDLARVEAELDALSEVVVKHAIADTRLDANHAARLMSIERHIFPQKIIIEGVAQP